MNNINIKSWKKTALNQYVHEADGNLALIALFTLGIIVALLHLHLRLRGLSIPGHHGMELMMTLLFGRMQSKNQWAAVIIATGAASTFLLHSIYLPVGQTVKPALFYLTNAFILDSLFKVVPVKSHIIFKGLVLGGISFIVKPVVTIPIAIYMEISFGSISKHGHFIPILMHFIFGSIGAICGITLANLMSYKRNN
ncbi:MAG: hypothetical protein HND53_13840 [Proteobacteria bacterium]|nr:hypothetical protein [Pseudomonadota bacterium]NOG61579.1 hypothetical protein [Pseudomonadota bacterium]